MRRKGLQGREEGEGRESMKKSHLIHSPKRKTTGAKELPLTVTSFIKSLWILGIFFGKKRSHKAVMGPVGLTVEGRSIFFFFMLLIPLVVVNVFLKGKLLTRDDTT